MIENIYILSKYSSSNNGLDLQHLKEQSERLILHPENTFAMNISSKPSEIHIVERELEKFCKKAGISEDNTENFGIATTEMVNNAIRHGNKNDPAKKVTVTFEKYPSKMKVTVRDSGPGFEPEKIADPLDPENLYKDSGRGIFIVKMLMDEVKFKFSEKGTLVILVKYL
ncbi:ATP-binding protein [candidate division KSB1 bacterium]|nr:ATP-binding protein [candidate division KSB1 bacterium]RQW07168.1 MAG: ATP-binding protein [candidate division KSB1 bacterium]